jgi:hypothetical protein
MIRFSIKQYSSIVNTCEESRMKLYCGWREDLQKVQ